MRRRTFLQAVGAASPLWLFSLPWTIRFDRSRSVRDVAPRRELSRCDACGELKGVVVDPDGAAKVASCRCEPSRCRRCSEVVHPRRICGYYWCEERETLIHVPWFVGMMHACPR